MLGSIVAVVLSSSALGSAPSAQDAWDHHFAAVNAGDVAAIMEDYREDSVVEIFDHANGLVTTFSGLQAIQNFFEDRFLELGSNSSFMAPVADTTDSPARQTFLIWNINASDHETGSETFLFSPDNSILRQSIAMTTGLGEPAGYTEVTILPRQPTTEPLVVDPTYAQTSAKAVWNNHWEAFRDQNLSKFMQDYSMDAELRVFDHSTGTLTLATGIAEIQGMIEEQFSQPADLSELKLLSVHVTDVAEGKQVFFVWSSSASGIVSAAESFILNEHNKIVCQNAAITSSAAPVVMV